ncbi:MAG: NAD(P)-binding protein [Tateyamaria sp.]|uniref:NAD(P)-binding protein n=1 Tax=Tateyamaria sp. TaxID=1929288 RepID=UPI00327BC316
MRTALVIGAGFEGMATAFYLRDSYGLDVTLVDAAPKLGGVMRGFANAGFHLDAGCQVFDNFDRRVSQVIDRLSLGQCELDTISYAARFLGKLNSEVSVPDLTALPSEILATIQADTLASEDDGLSTVQLSEYYQARWGATAADYLNRVNLKALDEDASKLDQSNRIYAGLSRLRLFEDDQYALQLKSNSPAIDAKVAVPRHGAHFYSAAQDDPGRQQNIVPLPHSMGSFCTSAEQVLHEAGINLRLGFKIARLGIDPDTGAVDAEFANDAGTDRIIVDLLVWCTSFEQLCKTLDAPQNTAALLDPIGTTITYYVAANDQFCEHGYVQNYDPDMRFFRWSNMGSYSRQIAKDGTTFCCLETPSKHSRDGNDVQAEAQRDWDDLVTLGLVEGTFVKPPLRRFMPNCIKRRRPGYMTEAHAAQDWIALQFGTSFLYQDPDSFGRTPTARQLFDQIDCLLT